MKIYDPVIDLKRYSRLMGEENFSREFSKTQIKEIIEHQITKFEIREKIVIIVKLILVK